MIETLQSWATAIALFWKTYPDLSAIIAGDALAGLILAGIDAWFYPEAWSIRKQQQVSALIMVPLGTLFSSLIWWHTDAIDGKWFIVWMCAGAAAAAIPAYYVGSKILSAFFPKIPLSFALKHNQP